MSWDFYDAKHVTTRKLHRCDWCGEDIEIGSRAEYISGKWDGDFQAGYYHLECQDASAKWVRDNDAWDEGVEPGSMVRGQPWSKDEDEEVRAAQAAKGGET